MFLFELLDDLIFLHHSQDAADSLGFWQFMLLVSRGLG